MNAVELRPLDWADPDSVEAFWQVRVAAYTADQPGDPPLCPVEHRAKGTHPWPGTAEPVWLVRAGGEVVGAVEASLAQHENLDVFGFELLVHPGHRGRGVGRAALAELREIARSHGRPRLLTEVADSPDQHGRSPRFAAAAGFRRVLTDVQRRLCLTEVDDGVHERLLAAAWDRAAGYSLLRWVDRTPEEVLDDVAVLEARMSSDPPFEDLVWEPEAPDPERVRERDAMVTARGMTRYVTAVRHDASGVLVGSTSVVRSASDPGSGEQWETIVLAEHRGHRLGMLLKLEELRFVRDDEPAVATIDTWNAGSNTHMVAVNDAMGFRPVRSWGEWEGHVDGPGAGGS